MNTWVLVVGIILLIIGLVMIIIGISIHENNVSNGTTLQPWYVWFLIIGGLVVGIVGLLVMAGSAAGKKKTAVLPPCPPPCAPVCPPPPSPPQQYHQVVTPLPSPAPTPQTQIVYTQPSAPVSYGTMGLPDVYPRNYSELPAALVGRTEFAT